MRSTVGYMLFTSLKNRVKSYICHGKHEFHTHAIVLYKWSIVNKIIALKNPKTISIKMNKLIRSIHD